MKTTKKCLPFRFTLLGPWNTFSFTIIPRLHAVLPLFYNSNFFTISFLFFFFLPFMRTILKVEFLGNLDMRMVAFIEIFFSFRKSPFLFCYQLLSSPTDTVLMLVTYHRNFCSHHGHHLCRGKNWRYDGFSFVPTGSSKLPYIHTSLHSCQGVRLQWKRLTRWIS